VSGGVELQAIDQLTFPPPLIFHAQQGKRPAAAYSSSQALSFLYSFHRFLALKVEFDFLIVYSHINLEGLNWLLVVINT
jgi:hypothetical protein